MNIKNKALSLYHPTTIIFVDDDLDTINNYSLSLPSHYTTKTFTVPEEAIEYINSSERAKPLDERCKVLAKDVNYFELEMQNPARFGQTCIVISDYAMPSMDGITFLKSLQNDNISKILLTGIGDERLAVEAFNNEVIDRFYLKNDRDLLSKISSAIFDMQRKYFYEISQKVNARLNYASPPFATDKAFIEFFDKILSERNICEYYLSHRPYGYLMMEDNGHCSRLVIYSEKDLQFIFKMSVSQNAPLELQEELRSDCHPERIPFFWKHPFGIYDRSCEDWENYMFPAQRLYGDKLYYYSIIPNFSNHNIQENPPLGFYDYLEKQENEANYLEEQRTSF